jgi:hypothetical protein
MELLEQLKTEITSLSGVVDFKTRLDRIHLHLSQVIPISKEELQLYENLQDQIFICHMFDKPIDLLEIPISMFDFSIRDTTTVVSCLSSLSSNQKNDNDNKNKNNRCVYLCACHAVDDVKGLECPLRNCFQLKTIDELYSNESISLPKNVYFNFIYDGLGFEKSLDTAPLWDNIWSGAHQFLSKLFNNDKDKDTKKKGQNALWINSVQQTVIDDLIDALNQLNLTQYVQCKKIVSISNQVYFKFCFHTNDASLSSQTTSDKKNVQVLVETNKKEEEIDLLTLFEKARTARENAQNHDCYTLCKKILLLCDDPINNFKFLKNEKFHEIVSKLLWYELAIVCYYTQDFTLGLRAIDRILEYNEWTDFAFQCLWYYVKAGFCWNGSEQFSLSLPSSTNVDFTKTLLFAPRKPIIHQLYQFKSNFYYITRDNNDSDNWFLETKTHCLKIQMSPLQLHCKKTAPSLMAVGMLSFLLNVLEENKKSWQLMWFSPNQSNDALEPSCDSKNHTYTYSLPVHSGLNIAFKPILVPETETETKNETKNETTTNKMRLLESLGNPSVKITTYEKKKTDHNLMIKNEEYHGRIGRLSVPAHTQTVPFITSNFKKGFLVLVTESFGPYTYHRFLFFDDQFCLLRKRTRLFAFHDIKTNERVIGFFYHHEDHHIYIIYTADDNPSVKKWMVIDKKTMGNILQDIDVPTNNSNSHIENNNKNNNIEVPSAIVFSKLGHMGRLGNQLLQVAGCHSLGSLYKSPVIFRSELEVQRFLKNKLDLKDLKNSKTSLPKALCTWPLIPLESKTAHSSEWVDTPPNSINNVKGQQLTYGGYGVELTSYFQSAAFWKHLSTSTIQHLFDPSLAMLKRVRSRENSLHLTGPLLDYCAIHVRRGDYVSFYDSAKGPLCLPWSYFNNAIEYMIQVSQKQNSKQKFRGFVFFSEDESYLKERLAFDLKISDPELEKHLEFHVVPNRSPNSSKNEGGYDLEALYLMASCGSYIISNSSFSWCAATLGDYLTDFIYPDVMTRKHVIVPDPWFHHVEGSSRSMVMPSPAWYSLPRDVPDEDDLRRVRPHTHITKDGLIQELLSVTREPFLIKNYKTEIVKEKEKEKEKEKQKEEKDTSSSSSSFKLSIPTNYYMSDRIKPIPYAIPTSKIMSLNSKKSVILADCIPGVRETYRFGPGQEDAYYQMYNEARFALTTKKGGWDCLRHYEILAAQCIPIFTQLQNCPRLTMVTWPKTLLATINKNLLPFVDADTAEKKTEYDKLQKQLSLYTKNYLSTDYLADYFLSHYPSLSEKRDLKILMLRCNPEVNYSRETLAIGLRTRLQSNFIDYPPIDQLYIDPSDKSNLQKMEKQVGFGFTYGGTLDNNKIDRSNIENRIKNKEFDLIIYGKVGPYEGANSMIPHLPLWATVDKNYSRDTIAFLFGGDDCTVLSNRNLPTTMTVLSHAQKGVCFVRELAD